MKKLLALVLALVMSLSLVTISNAAFKDADKISHDEAVTVMNAVGVLVGDNNGNFNAKDNLTRAQAAKIVSYLLLGNKTAEALAGSNKFSDVAKTNWAAGFIDYCATENIVAGVGNGQFAPEGQLTGYQFAKMLLVALGYDAKIEVFTGNDWQINVSKRADQAGLFDDLDGINGNKVLTRDEAAQMAFNALKSPLIEYENKGGNLSVNGAEINIGATQPKYKTTSTARKDAQTIFANHDNNNVGAYIVEFAEQYYPKLVLTSTTDDFGRPAYQWSYEQKDLGTFPVKSQLLKSYIGEVTGRDLYDLLGKTVVEGAGKYTFYVSIDGVTDNTIDKNLFNETYINKNNKEAVGGTGDGVVTEVYVDNDAKVVYICVINEYLARAAKDFDAKKDSIDLKVYGLDKYTKSTGGKTVTEYFKQIDKSRSKSYNETFKNLSSEDFALLADAKEDDAFVVTVANGELQSIVKANVVEDTALESFKRNSNVKAGGTTYKYSSAADYDFEVLDNYTTTSGTINLKDKTYNIYLDTHGNLLGIDLVTNADNYVFIAGVDTNGSNISSKNYDASAIFTDGTMKTIKFKSDKSKIDLSGDLALVNTWCTYTVDKDGVYTLTEVKSQINEANKVKVAQYHDAAFSTEIDKKHIALKGQSGSVAGYDYKAVYGNDDSVYLLAELKKLNGKGIISDVDSIVTGVKDVSMKGWNGATALSKLGLTAPASTSSGVYTLYKNNGYIIATVVVGEDEATNKNLVYAHTNSVEQESYDNTTDQWTWTRKVISDGEEIEIREVSDSLSYLNQMNQYNWYQVRYNAKGEVISVRNESTSQTWGLTTNDGSNQGDYVDNITNLENAVSGTGSKDSVLYSQRFGAGATKNDPKPVPTNPTMKGSTLYVDKNFTQGFYVSADAKIVFIQYNDGKKTTDYDTGAKAVQNYIERLNTKDGVNYSYQISAILLNGMAKVVVVNDFIDATYKGGTATTPKKGNLTTTATMAADFTIPGTTTVLKGSKANGTWTLSKGGLLNVTVDYTAPEWAAEGAVVSLTLPVQYLDSPIPKTGGGNVTMTVTGTVKDGKATLKGAVADLNLTYYAEYPENIKFGTATAETLSAVQVLYYWSDNTKVSDSDLATGSTTVLPTTAPSSANAFKVGFKSVQTAGTAKATVTNVTATGATISAGGDALDAPTATVKAWVKDYTTGGAKFNATNASNPVVVKFDKTAVTTTYTVTNSYKTGAALKVPTGYTAVNMTLTLSRDGAGIEQNGTVKITSADLSAALATTAPAALKGLKVTLSTGNVLYFKNDGATTAATIIGDDTFKVTGNTTVDVASVEAVDGPTIKSVAYVDVNANGNWDVNDKIIVTYSEAVDTTEPTLTFTNTGSTTTVNATSWNTEKTVATYEIATNAPAAGDTLKITAITSNATGVKNVGTYTITFGANVGTTSTTPVLS